MVDTIVPDFSAVAERPASEPKEMLSVAEQDGKQVVRVNSSSLGIILSCMRKSYYSLHLGMQSKHESSALTFGSAIHKALEVFYSAKRETRDIPTKFKEHSELMAHGHPAPEQHFLYDAIQAFVEVAQPLAALPDTDKRSIPTGVWNLRHYFETYIHDPYEVMHDADGPLTERYFEHPIYEDSALKIILFGTIDIVLKHAINGHVLPGDHKTTSQVGNDFFNRLKPNHQYTAYVVGAREVLGLDTHSFMVNGIQVKPRPKKNRGGPPHYTRQITERTDDDIEEFEHSLVWAVRQYLACMESDIWPLGHVDACAMWGGCKFHEVCRAPKTLRQNILESEFETPQQGDTNAVTGQPSSTTKS